MTRVEDESDNVTPIRPPAVLEETGGPPNEAGVWLGLYGEHLCPEEVTAELGCEPTSAHRGGSRKRPGSPIRKLGAWLLHERGKDPVGPDELFRKLLARFPGDRGFWDRLRAKYDVRLVVGLHLSGWNQGFELCAGTLEMITNTGLDVGFDIYFDGDE